MAFDNYYPNRKDWRKPYYKSKVFDWTCRNHGACSYCKNNRLFVNRRREPILETLSGRYGRKSCRLSSNTGLIATCLYSTTASAVPL